MTFFVLSGIVIAFIGKESNAQVLLEIGPSVFGSPSAHIVLRVRLKFTIIHLKANSLPIPNVRACHKTAELKRKHKPTYIQCLYV